MNMTHTQTVGDEMPSKQRLKLGAGIFITGQLIPLLALLVTMSGLPTAWKATLAGFILFGVPPLFTLVAVAVLGKTGFNYIRKRLLNMLGKYAYPSVVSRTRYRIGLVLFSLPLCLGWLMPYAGHMIPAYATHPLAFGLAGDVLFLASLLVLGGEFWGKLRALFIYGAKVNFPLRDAHKVRIL